MTAPRDIHAYLAELDDIPGTRIFTAARARAGYRLNQFAMSLMKPENRAAFKADEPAYLDAWSLTPGQRDAVLRRDYNAMLEAGGNIYFLAKIVSTDGLPFIRAVSSMSGMSDADYMAMMVAGGRSAEGLRSIKEQAALAAVAEAVAEIPNVPPAAGEDR